MKDEAQKEIYATVTMPYSLDVAAQPAAKQLQTMWDRIGGLKFYLDDKNRLNVTDEI